MNQISELFGRMLTLGDDTVTYKKEPQAEKEKLVIVLTVVWILCFNQHWKNLKKGAYNTAR